MSLREVARQLGVSPSFISQMENGKSQPSVATLYSMAQLLDVSIDELFEKDAPTAEPAMSAPLAMVDPVHGAVSRSDFSSPADAWDRDGSAERIAIVVPQERPRLVMDSGVIWEQLAASGDRSLDFMEIIYPAGASSTTDGRMLRHQGREYGYLISGTLEITFGFDTYPLRAGESMCLDPSVPHLLTNPGKVPARGIWVVDHRLPAGLEDAGE
jgi:transcriptional regulator with XRE-family HTH domain